jgi:hypothetical protein
MKDETVGQPSHPRVRVRAAFNSFLIPNPQVLSDRPAQFLAENRVLRRPGLLDSP